MKFKQGASNIQIYVAGPKEMVEDTDLVVQKLVFLLCSHQLKMFITNSMNTIMVFVMGMIRLPNSVLN